MQKIIVFLLAFFSVSSAYAFDTDSFAESFYKNIKNKVEIEEPLVIQNRVMVQTGLPESLIRHLLGAYRSSVTETSPADLELLQRWCGEGSAQNILTDCQNKLKKSIELETNLAELETKANLSFTNDTTWTNGTLRDGAFDLVVDLNIIDVILFGTEAKIPLARWESVNEEDEVSPTVETRLQGDSAGDLQSASSKNAGIWQSQSSDTENSGNTTGQNGTGVSKQEIIGMLQKYGVDANNLQCKDPEEFFFLDLRSNTSTPNDADANPDAGSGGATNPSDNPNTGTDGTTPIDGNGIPDVPLTQKQLCENSLYGGYYCRNSPLDTKQMGTESCDPFTGICKKCFGSDEYSSIRFCVTWQFKTSEHSLFSSTWVEDSVQGYVLSALELMKNLNASAPLTPKQQQNQGGFLTHMWDLVRKPGKMLYTEGKIPEMWLNESFQVDLSEKEILKRWQELRIANRTAYDSVGAFNSSSGNLSSQDLEKQTKDLDELRRIEELQALSARKDIESGQSYYKNILRLLQDFRAVYEDRIEKQMYTFPYQEILQPQSIKCESLSNK